MLYKLGGGDFNNLFNFSHDGLLCTLVQILSDFQCDNNIILFKSSCSLNVRNC